MEQSIISLDRDPRYVAARTRYTDLQYELSGLDSQLNAAYGGLCSLTDHRDIIRDEASALLSGATPAPASDRAAVIKTIDDLTHRIAVLRQAVEMQRGIVGKLHAEVGNAIASEFLPQHTANVAAIVEAAITLSTALQAEQELRDTLTENDVSFSSILRAMPLPGFSLKDDQSRLSRYLLECHEFGFIKASALPDVVRERLPRKAKPTPTPGTQAANGEGWLAA